MRKHSWQLIQKISGSHQIDICEVCGIFRKSEKNKKKEYKTRYSSGYTVYQHAPECNGVWKKHNWNKTKNPWEICTKCNANKLHTLINKDHEVWFKFTSIWDQEYISCIDILPNG